MKKAIFNQRIGYIKNMVLITIDIVLLFILYSCASTGNGNTSGLSLMDAIEKSAERITEEIPSGSRVAIVAFESESYNLSGFIMEELSGALFDRNIEVVERSSLEYIYRELDFQMSGDVSDETAQSIGKFVGAEMVVIGQLRHIGATYRFTTSAINVEKATRASVPRFDVRNDRAMQNMITALDSQTTTIRTASYGENRTTAIPQTAGTFLDRGIQFAMQNNYEAAIADFTEALRLNPNMAGAYILRGRAFVASASVAHITSVETNFSGIIINIADRVSDVQTRLYDLAIEDFTQAIRLEPSNAVAYRERGRAYTHKGDSDHAIADFNQTIRLNANDTKAYINRGAVYNSRGDYDRAIADYNQAIRLDPNNSSVYSNRGNVYNEKKDYDRAIADHNQAIRLDPNDAIAYINRGVVYYNLRNYAQAIADFENALRIEPNNTTAQSYLERARQARGR